MIANRAGTVQFEMMNSLVFVANTALRARFVTCDWPFVGTTLNMSYHAGPANGIWKYTFLGAAGVPFGAKLYILVLGKGTIRS